MNALPLVAVVAPWGAARFARVLVPLCAAIAIGALARDGRGPADVVVAGGCETFVGAVSGNDPDVRVALSLCRTDDRLSGQLVWNGASGTSVRDVEGVLDADGRVHLEDARLVVDAPRPGWMFCPVDNYALVWDPRGRTLSGTYASRSCDDTAGVWLQRSR